MRALGGVLALVAGLGPMLAEAAPLRLSAKVEGGIAFPLARPQRDLFGPGGGAFVRGAYGPLDWLDLQLTIGGVGFSGRSGEAAGLFGLGGGVRLQLPQARFRASPFVEADLLYVRTGGLDRFAYAVGAGALVAVDRARRFWIGGHVRYMQVVQPDEPGFDTTDAHVFMVGISAQLGTARRRELQPPPPPSPPPAPAPPPPAHVYRSVVVTDKALEISQQIFFAHNGAEILAQSYGLLDEIAQALLDHPELHVRIEGHTDDVGSMRHNLELSLARARSVKLYLVQHGVPTERMNAMGFGPTQPVDDSKTAEGRERNRRVEFVIEGRDDAPR